MLIWGETGTGKERVARAIHKPLGRCASPFVSVNSRRYGSWSSMFGHEKGAFTGALQRRSAASSRRSGERSFSMKSGDLPAETQIALLRVLQEREFERVGGTKPIAADVRVIAPPIAILPARSRPANFGAIFSTGLLNVFPIEILLTHAKGRHPLLSNTSSTANGGAGRVGGYAASTREPWSAQGILGRNIRELQNVVERAVIVCEAEELSSMSVGSRGRSDPVNSDEPAVFPRRWSVRRK